MLGVLRHQTYRRLFTAQVIALLGTGLATVALALLAYRIAGPQAGVVLGTALAIKMAANVIIAPVANALLAHVSRRVVLASLDAIRAVVAVLLPLVDAVWQIYVLVFVLQAASAAFTPIFQATIPDLLTDEDDYTHALSLSRLAYDSERLLSPALAAAALAVVGPTTLFLGTAAGFAASGLLVVSTVMPPPQLTPHTGGLFTRTTLGVGHYLAIPRLRGLLGLHLAVASAGAMVLVNTVTVVQNDLAGSETDVTAALGAYGTGSLLIALALPRVLHHIAERQLMLSGSATAAAVLLASTMVLHAGPGWRGPGLLLAWALLGAAGSLVLTPTGRLLRRSTDSSRRPALFAADYALSHGCWLITYPLAGWLYTTTGTTVTLIALAALTAATTGLATYAWSANDHEPHEHDHYDLTPDHPHLDDARLVGATGAWRHTHVYQLDEHHRTWSL